MSRELRSRPNASVIGRFGFTMPFELGPTGTPGGANFVVASGSAIGIAEILKNHQAVTSELGHAGAAKYYQGVPENPPPRLVKTPTAISSDPYVGAGLLVAGTYTAFKSRFDRK